MAEKYQWFNGLKFTRDDKSGYYRNGTVMERLHRYVWCFYNGPIPKGYEVHHIDLDKSNNDISNLALLTRSEHHRIHAAAITDEQLERMRKNLAENARPKASEWHRSEEGREWHRDHYEKMKASLRRKKAMTCENCGKEFVACDNGHTRFCSNACKSAWRRKSGVDNVERVCPVCGKTFKINKYSKQKTCSRSCANKLSWERRRKQC